MNLNVSNPEFARAACRSFGVFAACFIALATGCATRSPVPATIVNNGVENPSIGYRGYKLKVPQGFTVVPRSEAGSVNSRLVGFVSRIYDRWLKHERPRNQQPTFEESFAIHNGNMGIIFGIVMLPLSATFDELTPNQTKMIIEEALEARFPSELKVRTNEVLKHGNNYLGRREWYSTLAGQAGERTPIDGEFAFLIGNVTEIFVFLGATEDPRGSELHQAMEQIITGLTF
jgi:hypothetical protein